MPDPILIWTFRRSGSTSLADLLAVASGRDMLHEPFNGDRVFGRVTQAYRESENRDQLRSDVRSALRTHPNIKQCYDILPQPVHRVLLGQARKAGYRHVVLDRGVDLERALSLELALQTDVWGPSGARDSYPEILAGRRTLAPLSVARVKECLRSGMARRRWLAAHFDELGISPEIVFFEQVFGPQAEGRARVLSLMAALGLDPAGVTGFEQAMERALTGTSQGSASVLDLVPNIAELRAEIASCDFGPNPWAERSALQA